MNSQFMRVLASAILVFVLALTVRWRDGTFLVSPAAAEEYSAGYCKTTNSGEFCGTETYCKIAGILGCYEVGWRSIYAPAQTPVCPNYGPSPCNEEEGGEAGSGETSGGGSEGTDAGTGTQSRCNLGWCDDTNHAL